MVPPNGPAAACSTSTWIHWWSPVASANWSTRSWVISTHSLVPSSSPTAAASSSNVVNTRMPVSRLSRCLVGWPDERHRDGTYRPHPRDDPAGTQGAAARPPRRRAAPGDDRRAGRRGRAPAAGDRRAESLARWFAEAADSGSLERYLETFDHTVGGDADRAGADPGGARVRRGPGGRRRGVRRDPLRPRAARRARAHPGRGRRGGAAGLRRGRGRRRRPDRGPPAAHRDAAPGALDGDRRAGGRLARPRASPASTSPAPRPATRPPGTWTRSSTSSGRTPTSPSTPARRSGCRRSGRRSSGAAPTGSVTAYGSSTTSPWPTTARSSWAGSRRTSATSGSRSRCARRPTSRPGAATSIAEHPIGLLTRLRFRVTVNTDNRLMSEHLDDPGDAPAGRGVRLRRWPTCGGSRSTR